jgi:phosphatidylglycerophosphate synthase
VGQAGGWVAVVIPTREAFVAYLLVRAATLRRPPDVAPAIAERLEAHARALDLLVEVVRALPEDDERLLMLGTLVVRGGQFAPGVGTDRALNQFVGGSRDACETFLSRLVGIARDDAIARARAGGYLPPWRPR